MKPKHEESGFMLVTVICFAAILTVLVIGLVAESFTQMRIALRQIGMEQAFYAAEGGAERAVAYICAGGTVPATITGEIGDGTYTTIVWGGTTDGNMGETHSVSGGININPNKSPHNSFMLVRSDGSVITADDLHGHLPDQSGTAVLVHVQPKGGGNQNHLVIDGAPYTLENNTAHTISSEGMAFNLYNSNRNPQGMAVGHWWIELAGAHVWLAAEGEGSPGEETEYSIFSIGIANGVRRIVVLDGIHRRSWAKYALWYGADQFGTWFISGEKFRGPVHANPQVNFSGDPEFFEPLTSSHHTYGGITNLVTFHKGFDLNAPLGSMASVDFQSLRSRASLTLTGETSIAIAGADLLVSNPRRGWADEPVSLHGENLVYIETAPDGDHRMGDVYVGGTLDGRLTIAAEHDIRITDHLHYAAHPTNNSADALGLVAGRDVRIETEAPDDTTVFAHIMATGSATSSTTDGMFYVDDYNKAPARGVLSVYGGIVQHTRGPVGTFSRWTGNMLSGFAKNYEFDARFIADPPPHYPVIEDEYDWTAWREMAP